MSRPFILQGHRGARGLKPENTLPSFEVAIDLGLSSIETDVHLTRDGVPVLCHDPLVSQRLFRLAPSSTSPEPASGLMVSSLTLTQLRGYRADRNPDPVRFPDQDARATPLALLFAEHMEIDPFAPPTLADLFAFVKAYGGALGAVAGKTEEQRQHARAVNLDLELKRVPFRPEMIGDDFSASSPGLLELRVLDILRGSGMATVRSFDHRCVRIIRQLEPRVTAAVLISGTAPIDPVQLIRQADAAIYCPDVDYLDEIQVRQCHEAGIEVLPWTVNEVADLRRLLDWGVDGVTTDFPNRLADVLRQAGVPYARALRGEA